MSEYINAAEAEIEAAIRDMHDAHARKCKAQFARRVAVAHGWPAHAYVDFTVGTTNETSVVATGAGKMSEFLVCPTMRFQGQAAIELVRAIEQIAQRHNMQSRNKLPYAESRD